MRMGPSRSRSSCSRPVATSASSSASRSSAGPTSSSAEGSVAGVTPLQRREPRAVGAGLRLELAAELGNVRRSIAVRLNLDEAANPTVRALEPALEPLTLEC